MAGEQRRSTKAGASTPATPPARCSALNEGGASTPTRVDRQHHAPFAQRRPGPQPRRHSRRASRRRRVKIVGRSTKAGASTPATLADVVPSPSWNSARGASFVDRHRRAEDRDAQRRPGPQPRRHPRIERHAQRRRHPDARHEDALERSTKAGASTPATLSERASIVGLSDDRLSAQRRPGPQPRRHFRRSRRRGSSRSTPPRLTPARTKMRSAQRRPGPQPRRHYAEVDWSMPSSDCPPAQRRPGPQPRRHMLADQGRARRASPRAQRRPGPQPRRHLPRAGIGILGARPTLNEGRGLNPGDTANHIRAPLQRRIVQFSERQKQYACP